MKRGLTVAVAGAAILAAGMSGCSNNKSTTSGSGTSSAAGTSVSAGTGSGPKVTIDGKDQNVTGSVVCTTAGGSVNIAIGGAATGIAAVLTDASPPQVKSVGLGNVNGVTLGYTQGGQGNASATKDGSTYKITGTATGVDMANPTQPVNKPFEIDVTCAS
ncbi:MAG: lipoprotein LpqH [Mycobacterium sp.]|uniref:lipoprotein LpqH n=1 Tax=Mycobacterium sp. TaxID=1785 RepID=UPI002845C6FB|nr:lipoprotein LpqH [Mycobacterium sp.]HKI40467.1 lipoprotein LpqH [Mycobacterium sp.]